MTYARHAARLAVRSMTGAQISSMYSIRKHAGYTTRFLGNIGAESRSLLADDRL
jgi:hypothetical protein